MRVAWHIFLRDLKRILKNPVALVVTLGVAVIPCLYAWLNIAANWDPYKNTSTVPIAIVNEDTEAEVGSQGMINAGDLIVEALKENDQLGWTFVDRNEALDGVSSGRYYAAIVIPSDFTSSMADVLDGDTQKANIDYYVNEKINPVAPKVTDTGASTIEEKIDERFASVVSGVVLDKLQGFTASKMDTADETSTGLAADVRKMRGQLDELTQTLTNLDATITGAKGTIASAQETIAQLQAASANAAGTLAQANSNLAATRSGAQELSAQLMSGLITGSGTIAGISSRASYGIGTFTGRIGTATGVVDSGLSTLDGIALQGQQVEDQLMGVRARIAQADGLDAVLQGAALEQLDQLIALLDGQNQAFRTRMTLLRQTNNSVKEGAAAVEGLTTSVNEAAKTGASSLNDLANSYTTTTMPQVSGALDTFADVSGQLTGTMAQVAPLLTQTNDVLGQLSTTLTQAQTALASTRTTLEGANARLATLQTDLGTIQTTDAWRAMQGVVDVNRQNLTDFMESPAVIDEVAIYPVANYGSGIAPFFTSVALWVGGIALIVIYKMEVDPNGVGVASLAGDIAGNDSGLDEGRVPFRPWQGYLGRLMLLIAIGQLQAISCCTGNLILGIQCVNIPAYYFAAMVASLCFVNIIFSLTVAFKHIGRALAFVLIVLQVPGSSGMYPIEMMPGFFQAICPWLPFTYSNNAMREAIGGFYGHDYAFNLMMLCLFVLPALLVGMVLRRHLLNINALFDQKLRETDMVVAEYDDMDEAHFKLSTLIKAALSSRQYGEVFLERSAAFELAYPTLVRRGIVAVFVVPLLLLALLLLLPFKMLLLVLWIVSLIATCTYLIVVEYLHSRIAREGALANMGPDELYALLDQNLKNELYTFAPVEEVRRRRRATAVAEAAASEDCATKAAAPLASHEIRDVLTQPQEGGEVRE